MPTSRPPQLPGVGRWLTEQVAGGEGVAYLHIAESETGRFFFDRVVLENPSGVRSDLLRSLRLGRLEAALNSPALRPELERRLASGGSDEADLGVLQLARKRAARELARGDAKSTLPSLKIRVPKGGTKPDSFYEEVAALYSAVALSSDRPAIIIAAANRVPTTTVHRWVKEARRRGLLSPSAQSERSAE